MLSSTLRSIVTRARNTFGTQSIRGLLGPGLRYRWLTRRRSVAEAPLERVLGRVERLLLNDDELLATLAPLHPYPHPVVLL
jgi:hypothetical protein